jgi:hypothetical protein
MENRPQGPLLNTRAVSSEKSSCPRIVPRYKDRLPDGHVLDGVEVLVGTMAEEMAVG